MDGLREAGASVASLHTVGKGVPDLLVGFRGKNYLLEIKHGDGFPVNSYGKLTPAELKFFVEWKGSASIVYSLEQALIEIGAVEIN